MTEIEKRTKTLNILLRALEMESTSLNALLKQKDKMRYNVAYNQLSSLIQSLKQQQNVRVKMICERDGVDTQEQIDFVENYMDELSAMLLEVLYLLADSETAQDFVFILQEVNKQLKKE